MIFHNHVAEVPITATKSIVLVAMLTALSVAGRVLFTFIPNVTPVTAIVMITTILMGVRYGLVNAVLSIVLSNMVMGMGIWTIPQIVSLVVVVVVTAVAIKPWFKSMPHWLVSLYAGMAGLLYGFVISLVQAPIFGYENFVSYYLAGLPFDLMHAGGNVAFYFVLAPILYPLLDKLLVRYMDGV